MPSEFNLRINGDSSGLVGSVKHSMAALTGLEKKSSKLARTTSSVFKSLAILATGGLGIQTIQRYGDILVDTKNRLSLVTDSTGEAEYALQKLFKISKETRSSFEATAIVYSRVALAMRETSATTDELAQFTTTMNQAMILSGTKSVEAGQALIQLSQGMASGALRGDELRSVLEQLPYVADLIANEMGVTRGELRELGREGKILTKTVFDAMINSAEGVDKAFKKTTPSISQAANVFETSFIESFHYLNKSIPLVDTLAKSLIVLASNIGILGRSLAVFTTLAAGVSIFKKLNAGTIYTIANFKKMVSVGKENVSVINNNKKAIDLLAASMAGTDIKLISKNLTRSSILMDDDSLTDSQRDGHKGQAVLAKKNLDAYYTKGTMAKRLKEENKLLEDQSRGYRALTKVTKTFIALFTTVKGLIALGTILIAGLAATVFIFSSKIKVAKVDIEGFGERTLTLLDLITASFQILMEAPFFKDASKILETFGDNLNDIANDVDSNKNQLIDTLNIYDKIVAGVAIVIDFLTRSLKTVMGVIGVSLAALFLDIIPGLAKGGVKLVIDIMVKMFDKLPDLVKKALPEGFESGLKALQNSFTGGFTGEIDQAKERMSSLLDEIEKTWDSDTLKATLEAIVDTGERSYTIAKVKAVIDKATTNEYEKQNKKIAEQLAKMHTLRESILKDLRRRNELLQMSSREEAIQVELDKIKETLLKNKIMLESAFAKEVLKTSEGLLRSNRHLEEQRGYIESILNQDQERIRNLGFLEKAFKEGNITLDQYRLNYIQLAEYNSLLTHEQSKQYQIQLKIQQLIERRLSIQEDINAMGRTETDLLARKRLIEERLKVPNLRPIEKNLLTEDLEATEQELLRLGKPIGGIELGFRQVQEQTKLTAESVSNELVNAFGHAEDAMVEFFMTGRLGFKQMIDSMISDLVRFSTQRFIINAMVGGLSNMGSTPEALPEMNTGQQLNLPNSNMASGGITSGGLTMVGERGPEIAAFPKNTRIMSYMDSMRALGAASSSGNGAAPINVTVNQNIESSGQGQASDQDMLDKVAVQTRKAIKESIQMELKEQQRPRNMLNKGMSM